MGKRYSSRLHNVNSYDVQLSEQEIQQGRHREKVGGFWEEVGRLQLDYLVRNGLQPHHKLVDIGCGALRGGIPIIRYLRQGNYHGMDINKSLLQAGRIEIKKAGLTNKRPRLLLDDKFKLVKFQQVFDYGIAISLFTHLPMNFIIRCLVETGKVLARGGLFLASYFEAPHPAHLDTIRHDPGGITTNYDVDPFHYSSEELGWMAGLAGLQLVKTEEWGHPRAQKIAHFTPATASDHS